MFIGLWPDITDGMSQYVILAGLSLITVGLLGDGLGALLIALPNGPRNVVRNWVYTRSTRIQNLREAQDSLENGSRLRLNNDESLIKAIHPVLARELNFQEEGEPEEIADIANGFQISFRSGLTQNRTGINHRHRKMERWVNRAIERRMVYSGVIFLMVGFVFQIIGTIVQLSVILAALLSSNSG